MRTCPINEFDKTTCTRMAGHALELLIADLESTKRGNIRIAVP